MLKIAIVEDNVEDQKSLQTYIGQFFQKEAYSENYQVVVFDSAVTFLESDMNCYDVVFLDIQMPYLNGMDAAKSLREKNQEVLIVFVTNMAQYAVKGYDVDALGFVVKPMSYYDFYLRMKKVVRVLEARNGDKITLTTKQGLIRLSTKDIYYVEVTGHTLHFHNKEGVISVPGKIYEAEEVLKESDFMRCNNCYLVNPRAIQKVSGYTITLINGEEVLISRPKKKLFMTKLSEWLGGEKNL